MPLYDYAPVSGECERCGGRFEVMQRVADPKLERCPECAAPVARLISKAALGGKYAVTESKIRSSGLTRYTRAEDGVYERTAGSGGPATIFRGKKRG